MVEFFRRGSMLCPLFLELPLLFESKDTGKVGAGWKREGLCCCCGSGRGVGVKLSSSMSGLEKGLFEVTKRPSMVRYEFGDMCGDMLIMEVASLLLDAAFGKSVLPCVR